MKTVLSSANVALSLMLLYWLGVQWREILEGLVKFTWFYLWTLSDVPKWVMRPELCKQKTQNYKQGNESNIVQKAIGPPISNSYFES